MTRHPADIVSLAFGLLFAAIGLVLLSDSVGALSWEWLAPAAVIVVGVLLIVAARPTRRDTDAQPPEA
jgi:hypothetical protein